MLCSKALSVNVQQQQQQQQQHTSVVDEFSECDRFREDLYMRMSTDVVHELSEHKKKLQLEAEVEPDVDLEDYYFEKRVRDISGLRPIHRWQMHKQVPPMDQSVIQQQQHY